MIAGGGGWAETARTYVAASSLKAGQNQQNLASKPAVLSYIVAPLQDKLCIGAITKIKSNIHPGMSSKSVLFTSESYCCSSSVSKANSSESMRLLSSIIELSISC
jgi:hypothetical protein